MNGVRGKLRDQPRTGLIPRPDHVAALLMQIRAVIPAHALGAYREYQFHDSRKWRFDLAFPVRRVAIEVDGGAFIAGRHARGAGIRSDCEKFSEAAAMGWRVLRVLPEHVESGQALAWLERALA